jgi:Domain of unknown function (DUF3806)
VRLLVYSAVVDANVSALSDAEQAWIRQQLAAADQFVTDYGSARVVQELGGTGLAALDHAWASWLDRQVVDPQDPNPVINAVGVAFGEALIGALEGFGWVIATDAQGSDLAVSGLPGSGDVLVYPANVVAKRYESRTAVFLVALHAEMVRDIEQLR